MSRTGLAALLLLVLATAAPAQDPYRVILYPRYYWYGDELHGAADLVRAQGQFLMDMERTKLLQQELKQKKLETRRKELEHWAWERKFMALTYEDQKILSHDIEVRRVVRDARPGEIYSGDALNTLVTELLKPASQTAPGGSMPVDPDMLAHINVTGVVGNAGLLKAGRVVWPLLIAARPTLTDQRTAIDADLATARASVLKGETVDPFLIVALRKKVSTLENQLSAEVRGGGDDGDWSPGQYVAARRSLKELREALAVLERPDASYYLSPLKGGTVAEVVQHMEGNGLHFAPATIGDERFYTAMYYALRKELERVGGVPQRPESQ
jgi:hypothetical protein